MDYVENTNTEYFITCSLKSLLQPYKQEQEPSAYNRSGS